MVANAKHAEHSTLRASLVPFCCLDFLLVSVEIHVVALPV